MGVDQEKLKVLREKYTGENSTRIHDPAFSRVGEKIFSGGRRLAAYSGIPSLLYAPVRSVDPQDLQISDLDVALIGVPMDLAVSHRPGARFGPRALRAVDRIGPYNHVLDCAPVFDLNVADIGDVPFSSRYRLELSHEDIEQYYDRVVEAGVTPVSVGGDHSISLPILKALAKRYGPLGMIHIDAHCDTGGPFDQTKFHHGGPFRNAVLDGVLDPERTIQIGIRGPSEYLWEFSYDSGMTVIHAEEIDQMGFETVLEKIRQVVGDSPTYFSFDIDSLDPSVAPGTGTPEVGGLTAREALALVRGCKGCNLVGGDLVEVAPQYDTTTCTAHTGAQVLFEILSLMVFSPSVKDQG